MLWSSDQIAFLRNHYRIATNEAIAVALGLDSRQVESKLYRLQWKRDAAMLKRMRLLASRLGGTARAELVGLHAGSRNPFWKGGVSSAPYRYKQTQLARYPERVHARAAVYRALQRGVLTRCPCERCGSANVFAHHVDYSRPLEVRWLCRTHHREEHGGSH